MLDKMKPKFIEQASAKGHPEIYLRKFGKIGKHLQPMPLTNLTLPVMLWIAYQTAYLKAHYPAEYMAAVLSNNMNDIKQVTFFMEECKRMGLKF